VEKRLSRRSRRRRRSEAGYWFNIWGNKLSLTIKESVTNIIMCTEAKLGGKGGGVYGGWVRKIVPAHRNCIHIINWNNELSNLPKLITLVLKGFKITNILNFWTVKNFFNFFEMSIYKWWVSHEIVYTRLRPVFFSWILKNRNI